MKSLIELGFLLFIFLFAANKLPEVIKKARVGQLILIKEASSSNWGRPWTP